MTGTPLGPPLQMRPRRRPVPALVRPFELATDLTAAPAVQLSAARFLRRAHKRGAWLETTVTASDRRRPSPVCVPSMRGSDAQEVVGDDRGGAGAGSGGHDELLWARCGEVAAGVEAVDAGASVAVGDQVPVRIEAQ